MPVSVLTHHILQLLCVSVLLSYTLLQVVIFDRLVICEEVFNLLFVAAENTCSLSVKISLDRLQLLVIVISHLTELTLHSHDQGVNILRHLLDSLDIVAVLLIDLLFELFNELLLVRDDLGAGGFLRFDVL